MKSQLTPPERNPYRIEGPALLSISGGRTSAFMLAKILEAWEGKLPSDVVPIFCNTGIEHAKTYDFLRDIGERMCPLVWLEYVPGPGEPKHSFKVVDFNTAARNGEPFEALIGVKGRLPNPHQRFCTSELKIRTGNRFARSLGWTEWTRAVGLRFDEPQRVAKITGDGAAEEVACPMYEAKHTKEDVLEFWKNQPFDLDLPGKDNSFGNCTLCFLKSYERTMKILRADPKTAEWWIKQERRTDLEATGNGRLFRIDRPNYAAMSEMSRRQGRLFDDTPEGPDTIPCNCTD